MTKFTAIFFFLGLIQVMAVDSYAQMTRISLSMQNEALEKVLSKIEDESEFFFLYNKDLIDVEQKVSVDVQNQMIKDILNELLEGKDIAFSVYDRQIVLSNTEVINEMTGQQKSITGKVSDENGEPLPGVTVLIKGTTNGTLTNFDGEYTILNLPESATLQFSFVGMKSQEVNVGSQTIINITMLADAVGIDEVVVTAMGIKRQKREIGYSTQKVTGKDAVLASAPNIVSSLSGKVAGLSVAAADGVDGNSSYLTIRGNNNITGNNQPLFVIDGVPVTNDFYATGGQNTGMNRDGRDWGNPMNNINPYDVESIDVLKGPAAAALYGARGGNGAIIITTKKGRSTKGIGLSYSFNHRIVQPYLYRDAQDIYGGGTPIAGNDIMDAELKKNGDGVYVLPDKYSGTTLSGNGPISDFNWYPFSMSWGPKMNGQEVLWWDGEMRKFSPQTDNQELYLRNGSNKEHNISFSGAGDLGSVRVSITNVKNDAITYNSGFEQTTINLGSKINVSKKVHAEVSASYMDYSRLNAPVLGQDNNSIGKALLYNYSREYQGVDKQIYENPDGTKNTTTDKAGWPWSYGYFNSYWWNTYHNNQYLDRRRFLGSMSLNYEVTDWFNLTARAGVDNFDDDWTLKNDPTKANGIDGGKYQRQLKQDALKTFDVLAVVNRDNILDGLNAQLTMGGSYWHREKYAMKGYNNSKWSFPNGNSFTNNTDIEKTRIDEQFYEKEINSLYGILNLSYNDYLFLEVTGRNDISSTLPEGENSYFYPSANLSFIATEAMDLTSIKWMNFAKARVAFAQTASDAEPYQVDPTFKADGSFAGMKTYILPDEVPPIGLKPQRANSYEGGLIFGFFDNRINFDFTYYYIKSFDQILSAPLPQSSGANKYKFNTGELENRGIEIVLNANIIRKKDFQWNVDLNFSKNRNKVLELDEDADVIKLSEIPGYGSFAPFIKAKAGDQYGTIYGYGIEKTENGEKIVSDDGTHYITTDEMVPLGNATPKFMASMFNTFKYKNISLSFNIDSKIGGDVFAGSYATALFTGQSPETLYERQGNGLPLVGSDGVTYNNGVILDGVVWNGSGYSENETVVHAWYKYLNKGSAWGDHGNIIYKGEKTKQNPVHESCVIDNSWVKMRQVTLTYDLPRALVEKTKVFQSLNFSVVGRDLFYLFRNMPDDINPEGMANAGNGYGLEWGALPATRSISFGVNATF
uniref:SusC/RagA family TonB-linked outer membrane protein n=1 Tax=uncultured Draconibacterium sp. TaxID=1573823 RepID=UPI0032171956